MSNTRFHLPRDVAKFLLVDLAKVHKFIKSGQLEAVNMSLGTQPRWRISQESLDRFLASRQNRPPVKPQRKRRAAPDVVEFIRP